MELPRHAEAELYFPFQYSLSWLLAYAGVPAQPALAGGTLSYIALTVLGVAAAAIFVRLRATTALIVLFPVACAMLGGSFTHLYQVSFAVPAAVCLMTVERGVKQTVAAIGVMLLAVPWQILFVGNAKSKVLVAMVVGAVLVFFIVGEILARTTSSRVAALRNAAYVAVAVPVLGLALLLFHPFPPDPVLSSSAIARIQNAGPFASDHWSVYVREAWLGKHLSLRILLAKGYTWLGLIVVVTLGTRLAWDMRNAEDVARVRSPDSARLGLKSAS